MTHWESGAIMNLLDHTDWVYKKTEVNYPLLPIENLAIYLYSIYLFGSYFAN